jgi:methylenetetrahydrofolate reductase (NADPH)
METAGISKTMQPGLDVGGPERRSGGPVRFIRDIHAARRREPGRPVISFEFFPPKTPEAERALLDRALPALCELKPDFCSVTWGAGGHTRDGTLRIVEHIQRNHGVTAMAHLTCVNATREQIGGVLAEARARGIANILALRGDPPGGVGESRRVEGGFEFSWELVLYIRELGGFCIGTAGFPEGHVACREGKHADWNRLKAKIDCGADFVLTQLFFDNADFLDFRDFMSGKLGVTVPICPGVLPILSTAQLKRFIALCGARLPANLQSRLEALGDDDAAVAEFGIEYATRQCEELVRAGVPGLHFYTLNKAESTTRILRNLGLAQACDAAPGGAGAGVRNDPR